MKITVVIPVYNNSGSLRELTARLVNTLDKISECYEVIYVNDGSRDNSLEILNELAAENFIVKVINLSRNFGQHPAICAGFEHSSGDTIILMDADLQDQPEVISELVKKLRSAHVDVVYTIKKLSGDQKRMQLTSIIFHQIFAHLVKTNVPLNIGTFRVFNRKFLEALLSFKEVNILYGPLMFYMGFNSCFVEVYHEERQHGKSSYTFSKRLQLALSSLISYTNIPHKLSTIIGILILISSFFYAVIVLLQYLIFGTNLPDGNTLIILILSLALGSIMMSLGIIGSYVFRVYQEVLNRPRYLIQNRVNFSEDQE